MSRLPRPPSPSRLAARLGLRRRLGRPAFGWTARLVVAAVASYVVAEAAFPNSAPLTAPLTALLVVQLTPVSLLVSGLDRVVSVVAGVGVAVLLSSAIGLSWWSLGLIIGISLVVGQILRLGPNLLEVPISAMLILGAGVGGAQTTAAGDRIAQTLIGAAVGVLSNVAFPPRVVVPDAVHAIEGLAEQLADLLEDAAADVVSDEAQGRWLVERAGDWLGRARLLSHAMPTVGAALLRAEESRRLNVRALGTRDAGPGLRQGLEALEHCTVAVRGMFGRLEVVADRLEHEQRPIDPELRASFAVVLREMAEGLRSFGRLVRQDAERTEAAPDVDVVRAELQDLHEARARIDEFQLSIPRDDLVLTEVIASLGATIERLLRELDLDERARRLNLGSARPRRPLPLLPPMRATLKTRPPAGQE